MLSEAQTILCRNTIILALFLCSFGFALCHCQEQNTPWVGFLVKTTMGIFASNLWLHEQKKLMLMTHYTSDAYMGHLRL